MTYPFPLPQLAPEGSKPHQPWSKTDGCTSCGSRDTATVDGINGRRCANCPPRFDPEHAVKLKLAGADGALAAYLRTELDGAA